MWEPEIQENEIIAGCDYVSVWLERLYIVAYYDAAHLRCRMLNKYILKHDLALITSLTLVFLPSKKYDNSLHCNLPRYTLSR